MTRVTREEAIEILEYHKAECEEDYYVVRVEALDMAIKALKQEPCEDCVSKQGVAEVLLKYAHNKEGKAFAEFLVSQINDLPPVTPKPKTGHWINRHIIAENKSIDMIVCSECGEEFSYDAETGISEYNYCPNCGTKMESEG